MAERVVVTGVGGILPMGGDRKSLMSALRAGRSGIGPLTRFDPGPFRVRLAGQVDDFEPERWIARHRLKRMDRCAQFAVVACRLAFEDARLEVGGGLLRARWGVSCGTALGGFAQAEAQHARFLERGLGGVTPSLALQVFGAAAHSQVAIEFGLAGYSITNSNSCAAGAVAVGEAFRAIREGRCDLMVAVGAEAPLAPLTFGAFELLDTMCPEGFFPFDVRRGGFVMGEGSMALVCESRSHAEARGAEPIAEILGYALNNDAYHMSSPRPDRETIAACMRAALASANVAPEEIGYLNAHASGTKLNDATECAAIRDVFGAHAQRLTVSGTKPFHGHSLGAVGAVESAICCLALHQGWLPPTINLEQQDPACDLYCIPRVGVERRVDRIMKDSFGFGGINACLVFGRAGG
ncbi:MAG TPA: beta-ketoacyl-[acyl-carrier-protein] synthase family protein [Verrucomicrobiae bacterium]|nr:beta-ketoacyl-[acyl-carrier-protein] synthase family protein [Verrucomicrobiae bacterium]